MKKTDYLFNESKLFKENCKQIYTKNDNHYCKSVGYIEDNGCPCLEKDRLGFEDEWSNF